MGALHNGGRRLASDRAHRRGHRNCGSDGGRGTRAVWYLRRAGSDGDTSGCVNS